MEIKTVNRKIPENRENSNERFRVQYKDKHTFDLLVVNISRLKTNETQTFKFPSTELPDKDSIHFSTSIEKGKLNVIWKGISTKQIIKKAETNIKTSENRESKIVTEKI